MRAFPKISSHYRGQSNAANEREEKDQTPILSRPRQISPVVCDVKERLPTGADPFVARNE